MSFISSPSQKGQGLVEYALIMVLIAVVVIAVLTLLGPRLGSVYSQVNNLFPGVISIPEATPDSTPDPTPTEVPFGYASQTEAYNVFCSTYSGTNHFHVHHNSTTGRYIGLVNGTTSPAGFFIGPQVFCP